MKDVPYPAIFHVEEDGGYWVEFPDFGWVTQGDTFDEAYKMAGDLLYLYYGEPVCDRVRPSKLSQIEVTGDDRAVMVYPKYYNSKNPTEEPKD